MIKSSVNKYYSKSHDIFLFSHSWRGLENFNITITILNGTICFLLIDTTRYILYRKRKYYIENLLVSEIFQSQSCKNDRDNFLFTFILSFPFADKFFKIKKFCFFFHIEVAKRTVCQRNIPTILRNVIELLLLLLEKSNHKPTVIY